MDNLHSNCKIISY